MQKWRKVEDLQYILSENGYEAFIYSDYYVYKHINTELYRITIHDNPETKYNMCMDNAYIADIVNFFDEVYEELFMIEE